MSRRQKTSVTSTHFAALADYLSLRLREGLVILMMASAFYLLLSLLTFHTTDPGWSHESSINHVANAGGRVGAWLADLLLFFCGLWGYALPLLLGCAGWLVFKNRFAYLSSYAVCITIWSLRTLGFVLLSLASTGLISAYLPNLCEYLPNHAGGVLGQVVVSGLSSIFNFTGCILILLVCFLLAVTLFTGVSWMSLCQQLGQIVINIANALLQRVKQKSWRPRWPSIQWQSLLSVMPKGLLRRSDRVEKVPMSRIEPSIPMPPVLAAEYNEHSIGATAAASNTTHVAHVSQRQPVIQTKKSFINPGKEVATKMDSTPVIQQQQPKHYLDSQTSSEIRTEHHFDAQLPDLGLLNIKTPEQQIGANPKELELRSREVESRLADFGVSVQVVAVYPGPVVTRFEVQLAAGTKVSKISNLSKDLARSLSVVSVRVVEVIPGKSVIGIELPNAHREVVTLHEVLASKAYITARSMLSLALGKDIAGHPVVVDLAKMPHLLVAGTTGAGKSVSLNAMLLSLLYKATPEQLRMIMIDPKMLELSIYDGIPHLLTPVVTDMKDAASALRWCVVEMERRYRLMATLGVRNIAGYNIKVREAIQRGAPLHDPFVEHGKFSELHEMPQIVVLADEFADMMVVVGKKVETLIARLAQKARAAGIHLILATQRPSVDVITGLIKANIPTRIAFQVSSKIDSRTILDQQGAEQLLGNGDMLYLAPGTGVPVRVHGAYVSDEEVHNVTNYLKQQGAPQYISDIINENTGGDSGYNDAALNAEEGMEDDPFYDEAVHMVVKTRRVSVSSIQRRFKIGYNRAARIVEAMENAGVVSKMESNGTRDVLAPPLED